MSNGDYSSCKPTFIDQLAIDMAVIERRRVKLTSAEKRHAVHRLCHQQNLSFNQIAEVLGMTQRTVARMLKYPPPPILDVNELGQVVAEDGTVFALDGPPIETVEHCQFCDDEIVARGLCKMHHRRFLRGQDLLAPKHYRKSGAPSLTTT